MQANLKAIFLAVSFACVSAIGYSATTMVGNVIRLAVDGDHFDFSQMSAGPAVVKIEFTPSTTGTLYQLRAGSESGNILWETTATETRLITSVGTVVTAMGGLQKIEDVVTIQAPVDLYLNTTDTAGGGFTGMYLYLGRKDGNN